MRVIILSPSPFLLKPWLLSAQDIFDLTGGNTGNLAFEFAVTQQIVGDVKILPPGVSAETMREQGDLIVLPLANQLGAHTDLGEIADQLELASLPIIAIGLGAQADKQTDDITLTPGTERWLRTIASHSPNGKPNIGLRGEFTLNQLEKLDLGDAGVIIGCPSNFITPNYSFLDSVERKLSSFPKDVAVAAGIEHIPDLCGLERDLADISTVSGGMYVVQHSIEMIKMACGEFGKLEELEQEKLRNYIAPHLSRDEFKGWCKSHARVFTDVRSWMFELSRYDFLVGTRFHGAMLALQAGTPAGCISPDSRVLEMCETMKLPALDYRDFQGGITRSRLRDIFQFDRQAYEDTRKKLAKSYFSMLVEAQLVVSDDLMAVAR
jgi:hypothetical protein